jgi:hypothetical protein
MEYFAKLSELNQKYQDAVQRISDAYQRADRKALPALNKAAEEAHAELEAHEKKRPKN